MFAWSPAAGNPAGILYLLLWAAILPIQTVAVRDEGDLEPAYWAINALILALGIALNRFGRRRRDARERRVTAAPADAR